jgi:hypothetical protein
MKFYNVRSKKMEEIPEKDIMKKKAKNGRSMAQAKSKDGKTMMTRFI